MHERTVLPLPSAFRYWLTDQGHLAHLRITDAYYTHREFHRLWDDSAEGVLATTRGDPDTFRYVLGIASNDPLVVDRLRTLLPGIKYHDLHQQPHPHCWHDTGAALLLLPTQRLEVCCHCAERQIVDRPAATAHGPFRL